MNYNFDEIAGVLPVHILGNPQEQTDGSVVDEVDVPMASSADLTMDIPKLPHVYEIMTSHLAPEYHPALVMAMLPVLGALATNVRFAYHETGKLSSLSFLSCVIGSPACGKSTLLHMADPLLHPIMWEQDDEGITRMVGEFITTAKVVEDLDDAAGKHLLSIIHEVDFLQPALTKVLRYSFDNDVFDYSTKKTEYHVPVFWNMLVAGTPQRSMEFFDLRNVANGTISRICFVPIPDVQLGSSQMISPYTKEESDDLELISLGLYMAEDKISCAAVDEAIANWKQEKEFDLSHSQKRWLLPIIRRAAEIGFRAGMLCYLLEKDNTTFRPTDVAVFATWVSEYQYRIQSQLFGAMYKEAAQKDAAILSGATLLVTSKTSTAKQLFEQLDQVFNREDFMKVYAEIYHGDAGAARTQLSRLKAKGLIEEIEKGCYRKVA